MSLLEVTESSREQLLQLKKIREEDELSIGDLTYIATHQKVSRHQNFKVQKLVEIKRSEDELREFQLQCASKMSQYFEIMEAVWEAIPDLDISTYTLGLSYLVVDVEQRHLVALRKTLGRLILNGKSAAGPDEIFVRLSSERFPLLLITYRKKYKGEGNCKIVKATQDLGYSLVCNRG